MSSKYIKLSYYCPNEILIYIFEFIDELDYLNILQVDKQFYTCVEFILNSRVKNLDTIYKLTQYLFATHNCVSFVKKFLQFNQKSKIYFPASALSRDLPDEKTAYIYLCIAKYLKGQSIPAPVYNDKPKTFKILLDHCSIFKKNREICKAIFSVKPTKEALYEKISKIPEYSVLNNALISDSLKKNYHIIITQCFKYYPELVHHIDIDTIILFSKYLRYVSWSFSLEQWIKFFLHFKRNNEVFDNYEEHFGRYCINYLPECYFDIIRSETYYDMFYEALRFMNIPLLKYLIDKIGNVEDILKIDIGAKPTREIIDLLLDKLPHLAYMFYDHALIANDPDTINYIYSKNIAYAVRPEVRLTSSRGTYIHIENETIYTFLLCTGSQPEEFINRFVFVYYYMSVETLELMYRILLPVQREQFLQHVPLLVWPHLLGLGLLMEQQILGMYKMYKTKSKEKKKILAEFISTFKHC